MNLALASTCSPTSASATSPRPSPTTERPAETEALAQVRRWSICRREEPLRQGRGGAGAGGGRTARGVTHGRGLAAPPRGRSAAGAVPGAAGILTTRPAILDQKAPARG